MSQSKNMNDSEQENCMESAENMGNRQKVEMYVLKEELKDRDNQLAIIIAYMQQVCRVGPENKLMFELMSHKNCSTPAYDLLHIPTRVHESSRSQRSIRAPSQIHTSFVLLRPQAPSAPPTLASSSRKHTRVNVLPYPSVNAEELIGKPKRWTRSGQNMRRRDRGRYGRQGGRGRGQNKTLHVYIQ
ncbi:hypothetical protein PV325_010421 [Microctonus aethiopoides]|nr:hypothetical protein PV325_010421 [Microctonus aethiopoides]KAK0074354.1 hypothetical protein PV326_012518 [Microctonus aethiopoides]